MKLFHWTSLSFCVLLSSFKCAFGDNILFYWGVSGYSHRLSVWPLLEALSERGHNITFVSPYPSKNSSYRNPRITDIVPDNLSRDLALAGIDFAGFRWEYGPHVATALWDEYYTSGKRGCISLMNNPEYINWIKNSTFDLIVIDTLFNDCGYALVDYFKVPHIHYSPTAIFPWMTDSYGFPDENLPEVQHFYPKEMNFLQRVKNLLRPLEWTWKKQYDLYPQLEVLTQKALGLKEIPNFDAIERNVSLVMIYTHSSIDMPRSLPPMFVNVGGMHCRDERRPLPVDVESFIDSSGDEGFVLLSFGTYLSLSQAPKIVQRVFMDAIRQIENVKFLVKYEGIAPPDLPKNIKTVGWISQQDVIAHPKIKAFITHGGLLGTQEAIYHAVPTLVVPIFAEQDYNAMRAEERGTGKRVELSGLTSQVLETAIREVVFNETYKRNCIKVSQLFKDRETGPVESAVWWIEYVLRHKGTVNLRPDRVGESWFMRRSLDVWGFLFALVFAAMFLVAYTGYLIFHHVVYLEMSNAKKPSQETPKYTIGKKLK